jgi:cation efflux system protein
LATGIGSDVQRPLATVIVYGLMFSTLVSMFLLPAFYYLVENNVLNKKKNDEKEYTL